VRKSGTAATILSNCSRFTCAHFSRSTIQRLATLSPDLHGKSERFRLVLDLTGLRLIGTCVPNRAQPATYSLVSSLAASQERSSPAVRLYSEGRTRCRNEKDQ